MPGGAHVFVCILSCGDDYRHDDDYDYFCFCSCRYCYYSYHCSCWHHCNECQQRHDNDDCYFSLLPPPPPRGMALDAVWWHATNPCTDVCIACTQHRFVGIRRPQHRSPKKTMPVVRASGVRNSDLRRERCLQYRRPMPTTQFSAGNGARSADIRCPQIQISDGGGARSIDIRCPAGYRFPRKTVSATQHVAARGTPLKTGRRPAKDLLSWTA